MSERTTAEIVVRLREANQWVMRPVHEVDLLTEAADRLEELDRLFAAVHHPDMDAYASDTPHDVLPYLRDIR